MPINPLLCYITLGISCKIHTCGRDGGRETGDGRRKTEVRSPKTGDGRRETGGQ